MPWGNQVLLGWEEVSSTALHNLNVTPLSFHQVEKGGGLRNCLWDAKGCSCVRGRRHQIICLLKFSHCLLLPLSHNPQVGAVLLSQSQDLTHPGNEAILPGGHLARVWGKVLVIAVVLQVRLAWMESKVLSWMMVMAMTPAHDNLQEEDQHMKGTNLPKFVRRQQEKLKSMGIDLLNVTLLSHNLLPWDPWGNHIGQVRSLNKIQM